MTTIQPQTLGIVHVLFMDIVGYSTLSMNQQIKSLQLLQEIVKSTNEFCHAQENAQLISLPTGDGMALVFFSHPVAPVQCALEVSLAIKTYPEIKLRMGVHSGPIYQVEDINAGKNVAGSGINVAQRVMDCGDAGHILLSKRVADDLAQIGDWDEYLHDLGEFEVKHGVLVHIFNLYTAEAGSAEPPKKLRSQGKHSPSLQNGHTASIEAIEKRLSVPISEAEPKQSKRNYKYKLALLMAVLMIGFVIFGMAKYVSYTRRVEQATDDVTPVDERRLYWQETQEEQKKFIEDQAQRISAMLGPSPYEFSDQTISRIKQEVDEYVNRRDSLSPEIFKEGLRPLYSRASLYAPFIVRNFNERHVPPVVGLYIAMIETEYHPCDENAFGGKGLFGFSSKTALEYELNPEDRCDSEKSSQAAAHYIDNLTAEFGSDAASMTLVIWSYYRGADGVRKDLRLLLSKGIRNRSYWSLAESAYEDKQLLEHRSNPYVPRFFAAAIIGENPQMFALEIQPLSSYSKIKSQQK